MEAKKRIRANALRHRDELGEAIRQEMSGKIWETLICMEIYRRAGVILCYVNYKSEVETGGLIEHALASGKRVYCPRVCGEEMDFYRIGSMTELRAGYKGIREPADDRKQLLKEADILREKCLMIMPGSAFDKNRNRIGYGKGYYDRYLESHQGISTAAICFSCQLTEEIPAEAYDRKPDVVITEEIVISAAFNIPGRRT